MRGSEKFYAEFTLVKGVNCTVGVVRSDFDIERHKLACSTPDGWGYYARMGSCHHNKPRAQGSWVGQKSSREGDTIGLLLDPSRGTLSVFLNGSKAGDMVRTGLPRSGSLCWMPQPQGVQDQAAVTITAADLRRMGTKANMRLDNQTIQQVLNALERPGQGREEPADSQPSFSDPAPACTCYVKVQLARYVPNRSFLELLAFTLEPAQDPRRSRHHH